MNSRNFKPAPKGFAFTGIIAFLYCGSFAVGVLILCLLGETLFAEIVLGIGLCSYIIIDVLMSIKKNPPARKQEGTRAIFTCCMTAIVLAVLVVIGVRNFPVR